MPEALILTTQQDAVRCLTLNRPAALNAFTAEMLGQLQQALDAAAGDANVRCVLIAGAGRAFCAGQDLNDPLVSPSPDQSPEANTPPKDLSLMLANHYQPMLLRLRSMPVPVVAAVNGVAAGVGASLAVQCDIVLAAQSASFIQAFARLGLVPDGGGTWLLPRLVGRAKALELALLGDKLPAAEAERIGLIARCVPDADLMSAANALAQRLANMPVAALVATRRAMDEAALLGFEAALQREAQLQGQLGRAHDFREAASAFIAKRSPRFTDR